MIDSRTLRILHVIDHMGSGGAQQCLRDILPRLSKHDGLAMHLMVLRKHKYQVLPEGSIIKEVDGGKYCPLSPFHILRYILKHRIDVLHLSLEKSVISGMIAALFSNVKVIVHEHNDLLFQHPIYRYAKILFKKRVNKYITVSEGATTRLLDVVKGIEANIVTIHNGVDLAKFDRAKYDHAHIRREYGLAEHDFIVGFIGRLAEQKRPELAIAIAEPLVQKYSNIKVLIIGDGPDKDALVQHIQAKSLGDRIRLMGYSNNVGGLLSIMDVGMATSQHETFQISLVEMFAMGIPVVSFDIAGQEELTVDGVTGFKVPYGDLNAFRNRLEKLYLDRALRQQFSTKVNEVAQRFDIERCVEEMVNLYRDFEVELK
jgi:glycosyltransferase involved in cell wall biosynthesis